MVSPNIVPATPDDYQYRSALEHLKTPSDEHDILIAQIRLTLDELGRKCGFAGSLWGSLARRELCPGSDVDIVCATAPSRGCIEPSVLNGLIQKTTGSQRRIDTVVTNAEDLYSDFALKIGTDAHSIYFATAPFGDPEGVRRLLDAQQKLMQDPLFRVREFFNSFVSSRGLSEVLNDFDPLKIKLGREGTNQWVRLAVAAQMRWPRLAGENTAEVLDVVARSMDQEPEILTTAFNRIVAERRGLVIRTESERACSADMIAEASLNFLRESLDWISSNSRISSVHLAQFLDRFGLAGVMPEGKSGTPDTRIDRFLEASSSTNSDRLLELASMESPDWWTATALTANRHTPPEALEVLAFPAFEITPRYWQTVRLYVAKSKFTQSCTLQKLLETPGLREQDYTSARCNLQGRGEKI
jgi:hypothetical protein